jgi:hypothetical protein
MSTHDFRTIDDCNGLSVQAVTQRKHIVEDLEVIQDLQDSQRRTR